MNKWLIGGLIICVTGVITTAAIIYLNKIQKTEAPPAELDINFDNTKSTAKYQITGGMSKHTH